MASAKKIYAANQYAANQYAAGIWRGVGQAGTVIKGPFHSSERAWYTPGSVEGVSYSPGSTEGVSL